MSARDSMARFIRWVMRETVYHAVYTARVMAPSSGDTVDLVCEDPRLAGLGLQGVPVAYGTPDTSSTTLPGATVLLVFENGDPTKPLAVSFRGSAVSTSFGGPSAMPVARVGDSVAVTVTGVMAGPSTVTAIGTIVGGATKTKAG